MHPRARRAASLVSDNGFLHALNYCMILPVRRPNSWPHIGWLMHGVPGGLIAVPSFVIPGSRGCLRLAATYALYGTVTWVAGLLFGISRPSWPSSPKP